MMDRQNYEGFLRTTVQINQPGKYQPALGPLFGWEEPTESLNMGKILTCRDIRSRTGAGSIKSTDRFLCWIGSLIAETL